ncbi:MAG TPA: hypothetical protein VMS40_24010, partial [Vicinamibacterales bacterium]|nr:hypothetical protein [Vicinamibacterales bacterium]
MVELVCELASHFGDTPAGWVSDRASFDDRGLDVLPRRSSTQTVWASTSGKATRPRRGRATGC